MAAYLQVAPQMSWHDRRRWAAAATLMRHGDPEALGLDVLQDLFVHQRSQRAAASRVRHGATELMEERRPSAPIAFDAEAGVLEQAGLQVRPGALAMRPDPRSPWRRFGSAEELLREVERCV